MKRILHAVPVLLLALATSGCGYNRIQELDESVEQARANIQAELQRRNDLIPNLVATVDEAARFEQETFTQVAQARAGLQQSRDQLASQLEGGADADEIAATSDAVGENLRLFLNVAVEAYPQLTASQNFRALQDELTETENRLAVTRRDYNEVVATHNTYVRRFPQVIIAKIIGADRKETFEAPASAQEAPQVQFDRN